MARHWCAFVHEVFPGRPNMHGVAPGLCDKGPFMANLQQMVSTNFKPVDGYWDLNPFGMHLSDDKAAMLADPGKRKTYRVVMDAALAATTAFEKTLTPIKTFRAICALHVMDVSLARVDPSERAKIRGVDDAEKFREEVTATAATIDAESQMQGHTLQMVRDTVMADVHNMWYVLWLTQMHKPHAKNVKRKFNLVAHRLEALRSIPNDKLLFSPEWWAPALPVFVVDEFYGQKPLTKDGYGTESRCAPWDWRAEFQQNEKSGHEKQCWNCEMKPQPGLEKSFKYCAECLVARVTAGRSARARTTRNTRGNARCLKKRRNARRNARRARRRPTTLRAARITPWVVFSREEGQRVRRGV